MLCWQVTQQSELGIQKCIALDATACFSPFLAALLTRVFSEELFPILASNHFFFHVIKVLTICQHFINFGGVFCRQLENMYATARLWLPLSKKNKSCRNEDNEMRYDYCQYHGFQA